MTDAKQGVKPIKVIKESRELYSKNHVYVCFQLKVIVFCSPAFSTSLTLFLEQKTSECFLIINLDLLSLPPVLLSYLLSSLHPHTQHIFLEAALSNDQFSTFLKRSSAEKTSIFPAVLPFTEGNHFHRYSATRR